jgi:predicted phosphodiesterase
MNKELMHLCNGYQQRPRYYDAYFDQLYKFIESHPSSTMMEINQFLNGIIHNHHDLNTGDMRMIRDARKLHALQTYKVSEAEADVAIPQLEDGESSELTWHTINHKRVLVLSDIHFPYHCKQSLMVALRFGRDMDVDAIILNGDILDFYQLSKFSKNPKNKSVKDELDIFRFFINQLKQRFPDSTIYFKCGNHELRLEHWIRNNANQFDGMFELDNLVKFKENGVVYLKDNVGIKLGKLNIIHGHEIRATMGAVNIARTYYMKAQANILFGHWHQSQEYITRTMDGTINGAWTNGCLSKLDASYTYGINQWVNGFAYVELLDDSGNFRVSLKKIINGELV